MGITSILKGRRRVRVMHSRNRIVKYLCIKCREHIDEKVPSLGVHVGPGMTRGICIACSHKIVEEYILC